MLLLLLASSCSTAHYRKAADQEVYRIIRHKEARVLGKTNDFSINTPYSARNPRDIRSVEIIQERLESGKRKLGLEEALALAVTNSRTYQLRKEALYLAGLTLTRDRYEFRPKFSAGTTVRGERRADGEQTGAVDTHVSMSQLFKSGANLGASIANDLFRFYTGDPRRTALTTISADILQPLLRGAGAQVVAENLTQSERN